MNETAFLWISAAWVTAVGGCVGSFLNVVVYRLPAGINLSVPPSHCPRCSHPIRWHDNVPVFGWLGLRGRCRDCHTWIPVRYPAVEAAVAALFLLLYVVEGVSLGENLPVRPVAVVGGLIYPELLTSELATILGWHLLLLCTLLAASLIRYDGHDVPPRLFFFGFAVALLGSIVWPHLHPQPALLLAGAPAPGAVDGLAGLAVGVIFGVFGWKLLDGASRPDFVWASALTGAILGWQASATVGAVVLLLALLSKGISLLWTPWRRIAPVAWLTAAATLWIVFWRPLIELFSQPGA